MARFETMTTKTLRFEIDLFDLVFLILLWLEREREREREREIMSSRTLTLKEKEVVKNYSP